MGEWRCLTVRQPWAWAIAHGGKHVENRARRVSYRGHLAIHAGSGWSDRGFRSPLVRDAWSAGGRGFLADSYSHHGARTHSTMDDGGDRSIVFGAVVAVAELTDCHPAGVSRGETCCAPWGESSFTDSEGKRRTEVWHLVLEHVAPLTLPLPASGALGLWRPDPDLLDALTALEAHDA